MATSETVGVPSDDKRHIATKVQNPGNERETAKQFTQRLLFCFCRKNVILNAKEQ